MASGRSGNGILAAAPSSELRTHRRVLTNGLTQPFKPQKSARAQVVVVEGVCAKDREDKLVGLNNDVLS